MRRESRDNETKMREDEDSKGRGGDRLKLRNVDGDVPLSMRIFDEEYKESSSKRDSKNKTVCGSNDLNSRKEDSRSKTASGSKDPSAVKQQRKTKNMEEQMEITSPSSCYKKQEINALKGKNRGNDMRARRLKMGCRCSLTERDLEACQVRNLGDTSQTHIHGCRKIRQQARSWNSAEQEMAKKIIDTENISERAIKTTIMVNHQRIKLMSV